MFYVLFRLFFRKKLEDIYKKLINLFSILHPHNFHKKQPVIEKKISQISTHRQKRINDNFFFVLKQTEAEKVCNLMVKLLCLA